MEKCVKCGAEEVMKGIKMHHGDGYGFGIAVREPKDPSLFMNFRDSQYSQISANVRGNCGNIEFKATDFALLYKYWQKGYR